MSREKPFIASVTARDDVFPGQQPFAEGGLTGREMAAYNWADHPLGLPQHWDPLLFAMVNTLLGSAESSYLVWGEEMWFFSNDAYRPVLGPRVADAVGTTLPMLWADAWPAVRSMAGRAMAGEASSVSDYHIRMARYGVPEDTWWTFSYSPVRDARGRVAGFLCITNETTGAVTTAARLRSSEAQWQALFDALQEGLLVGELIRGEDGRIDDFRLEEFNPAWQRLSGIEDRSVKGRTVREVFGQVDSYWIDMATQVVERQAAQSFVRQFGATGRSYDGVAQPLGGDRFVLVFSDVTDRVRSEQERSDIEQRRRLAVEIGDVGLWDIDLSTGTLDWDRNTCLLFGSSESSRPKLSDMIAAIHPGDRPEFERRFAAACDGGEVFEMKFRVIGLDDGIERRASMKGVSLREGEGNGEGAGGGHSAGLLVGLHRDLSGGLHRGGAPVRFVGAVRDITRRVRNEHRRATLNNELAHRMKNTLAVVSAIVSQTLRDAPDVESGRLATIARIRALSAANDVVMTGHRNAATIRSIVEGAAAVHDQGRRIMFDGPDLTIGARSALSLSLIVHELATNAGKYGALSVPEGRVKLAWSVEQDGGSGAPMLSFHWAESGGPPVRRPKSRGFGTELLEMGLADSGAGRVRIDYAVTGVQCHLTAPLAEVTNDGDALPLPDEVAPDA